MSLVEVLPVEPVIATTFAPPALSSPSHALASDCSPASGSACARTTPSRCDPSPRSPVHSRRRLRVLGLDQHSPGPGLQRLRRIPRPRRRARPPDRRTTRPAPPSRESILTPRVPAARAARRGSPARLGSLDAPTCTMLAPAASREGSGPTPYGPAPTIAARSRARNASRATVTSSNGTLTPAGQLLALLVALAGDHHHIVLASASAMARSIALRRSTSTCTGAPAGEDLRGPGHDLRDDLPPDPPTAGCPM